MLPLNKKPYRVFSLWLRIFHWTMVLCVTALFWTGLYIGNPGFQATPGSVEPTIAVGGWFSTTPFARTKDFLKKSPSLIPVYASSG